MKRAFEEIRLAIPKGFDLYYPPLKWGIDTGKTLNNILSIKDAELVIFDVTPELIMSNEGDQVACYNTGVMIEYGIVLAQEHPNSGLPWNGRLPKPTYRLFCQNSFLRSRLTPIVNEESVTAYSTDDQGKASLLSELKDLIRETATKKLNATFTS